MPRVMLVLLVTLAWFAAPDPDVTRAFDAARALAAGGNAVAQFSLGRCCYGSDDTAQGVEWIRKAAARQRAGGVQMGQIAGLRARAPQSDREALRVVTQGRVARQRARAARAR